MIARHAALRAGSRSRDAAGGVERLREIADDVVGMFEADRKPHVAGRHAGRELLVGVELLMRGRGRMDRERARVADVGDVIEKLQRVDEPAPRLDAALQLEADQRRRSRP